MARIPWTSSGTFGPTPGTSPGNTHSNSKPGHRSPCRHGSTPSDSGDVRRPPRASARFTGDSAESSPIRCSPSRIRMPLCGIERAGPAAEDGWSLRTARCREPRGPWATGCRDCFPSLRPDAVDLKNRRFGNTPGRTRTCNPRFRRPMLYPLSYGCARPIVAVLWAGQRRPAVPGGDGGESVVYPFRWRFVRADGVGADTRESGPGRLAGTTWL
jgi:hypothetical protein